MYCVGDFSAFGSPESNPVRGSDVAKSRTPHLGQIVARVPVPLHERLLALAEANKSDVAPLVRQALEIALPQLERIAAGCSWADPTDAPLAERVKDILDLAARTYGHSFQVELAFASGIGCDSGPERERVVIGEMMVAKPPEEIA